MPDVGGVEASGELGVIPKDRVLALEPTLVFFCSSAGGAML